MVAKIKKFLTKLNFLNLHIPPFSLRKRSGSNEKKRSSSKQLKHIDESKRVGESHYCTAATSNHVITYPGSDDSSLTSRSLPSVQSMPSYISELVMKSPKFRRASYTGTTSKLDDSSLSRIYILLLAPETKQFELLEICNLRLSAVTIGDILGRIPSASTVHGLGSRYYTGLCRPENGIEMTDHQVPAGIGPGGWRITRGEILIAIPQGFSGQECKKMCCQILLIPKLVKLLQRKDPLAPKKKKHSSSSSCCSISSNKPFPSEICFDAQG